MNEKTRENLSALIDGELTPNAISEAVKELTDSEDLRGDWDRFHVIGDVIRGEEIFREYRDVAAGVRERIQQEPAILAPAPRPRERPRRPWVKPAVGSVLAASVAAIAILATPQFIDQSPSSPPLATRAPETSREQLYAPQSGTRWNLSKPDVESKLNAYLINHQEYAPTPGVKGMLPYVTFVSYDAGR